MVAKSQKVLSAFLLIVFLTAYSCSTDTNILIDPDAEEMMDEKEEKQDETKEENEQESSDCSSLSNQLFNEENGLVLVEFENADFTEDWALKSDGDGHTGGGYMVWEGAQYLGNPGNGMATFKIKIESTGTYQFIWHSAVKTGTSGTDHNDTWLRFADADDFYAKKNDGSSTVYPKGTGKTPNPEGATADGWFKIYRSGNNLDFKWQSATFDNNAHDIFVQFDEPGTYVMEVSARSSGHGIDKFVLFSDAMTKADAISSTTLSVVTCED